MTKSNLSDLEKDLKQVKQTHFPIKPDWGTWDRDCFETLESLQRLVYSRLIEISDKSKNLELF